MILKQQVLVKKKYINRSVKNDNRKKIIQILKNGEDLFKTIGKDCNIYMNTKWFEIKRDDQSLIKYISGILEVLNSEEAPKENPSCGICNFRKKIIIL